MATQLREATATIHRLNASLQQTPSQTTIQYMLNEATTRATTETETLRTDQTLLTKRVAELTRETAGRYSQAQHDEAKQRAADGYAAQLNEYKVEAQSLLTERQSEITRLQGLRKAAERESTTNALDVDATSRQAQFIRQLRDTCETLAAERDTYRRNAEDYLTQLSRADVTAEQLSAKHYDEQAAARHENEGLKTQVYALTDVEGNRKEEHGRLTSTVTQLREQLKLVNAQVETMNRETETPRQRND